MTVFWSSVADRFGPAPDRRDDGRELMAVGGCSSRSAAASCRCWSGRSRDDQRHSSEGGIFQTVEQAILPQTARTSGAPGLFAIYNTVANFAGALGSLAGRVRRVFFISLGLQGADAYRPFLSSSTAITAHQSRRVPNALGSRGAGRRSKANGDSSVSAAPAERSRSCRCSSVSMRSRGGSWSFRSSRTVPPALGPCPGGARRDLLWVNVLSGFSLLAAGWLAHRIGLLNTMVFTLPSNVLLMLIPLMPSAGLASRAPPSHGISQMEVPERQSYTMAIVDAESAGDRGITNVARTTARDLARFVGMAFSAARSRCHSSRLRSSRSCTTASSTRHSAAFIRLRRRGRVARDSQRYAITKS